MFRRFAIVLGLAVSLAAAHDAAAQSAEALRSRLGRPRVFNPFLPFSFSRLASSPLGLPTSSGAALSVAPVAAPLAISSSELSSGGSSELSLVTRPTYQPPKRSPFRPPPRPPF